jgi:folate-binding protein YgfZ
MTDDTATIDELAALREGAAVAAHGLRACVRVSGDDHREWLDRISSMPIIPLEPGRFTWSTLMDGKGKMRCDMRVAHLGDAGDAGSLLVELPASHHANLMRVLDMYILRDKVELTDLSASHTMVSVLGPRAEAGLADAGLPVPGDDRVVSADGVHAMAARLFGVPGADLLVEADAADALVETLVGAGALRVGRAALDVVRVEAGVPWFAEDMADAVIPLEAGLDEHVSITKGCYPGQEVVARIANLGQVARKLVRLSAPGAAPVASGSELLGTGERIGKPAGTLTSVVHDPGSDRTLALGYARRAFWKDGSEVTADGVTFRVEGPARP